MVTVLRAFIGRDQTLLEQRGFPQFYVLVYVSGDKFPLQEVLFPTKGEEEDLAEV